MRFVPRLRKSPSETTSTRRSPLGLRAFLRGSGAPSIEGGTAIAGRRTTALATVTALGSFIACAWLLAAGAASTATAQGTLPGQGFLPDERAWEMVSPPQKNGHDVSPSSWRVRVADDGSAASFMSLGGFPGVTGVTPFGADYLSVREGGGWATHPITPPLPAPVFPQAQGWTPGYHGEFSPDLDTGVFLSPPRSPEQLTAADPNVAEVSNLTLRTDLRSPGFGDHALLSKCPGCDDPLPLENPFTGSITPELAYAGASADYGHVIFESTDNLTGETTGTQPKLYEWVRASGEVRYVGVLPDSECGTPPCIATGGSIAGSGSGSAHPAVLPGGLYREHHDETMHAISDDGSRIFFTTPPFSNLIGSPNLLGLPAGELYVRENGSSTTQINVSERTEPDPDGPKPAAFGAASADGSVVYFLTAEALTDEDENTQVDLYRADLDAPEGERLTLVSSGEQLGGGNPAQHVVGISTDGEYVYWIGWPTSGDPDLPAPDQRRGALYARHHDADAEPRWIADYWQAAGIRYHWGDRTRTHLSQLSGPNALRVTPDGRRAVFVTSLRTTLAQLGYDNLVDPSGECLAGGQHAGFRCNQVVVYDHDEDELACASCNPSGAAPHGDASLSSHFQGGPTFPPLNLNRPITDDGSAVFFSSPEPLVPHDTNGRYDVYRYDVATGDLALLSGGRADTDSRFMDATPDGESVYFTTREQLVGIDTDDNVDLYVARVDGGLASQSPPPPAPGCQGDECQGEASGAPEAADPGSAATFPGNQPDLRRCQQLQNRAQRLGRRAKNQRQRAKSLRQRSRRQARRGNAKRAKALRQRSRRAQRGARQARQRAKRLRTQARECRQAGLERGRAK